MEFHLEFSRNCSCFHGLQIFQNWSKICDKIISQFCLKKLLYWRKLDISNRNAHLCHLSPYYHQKMSKNLVYIPAENSLDTIKNRTATFRFHDVYTTHLGLWMLFIDFIFFYITSLSYEIHDVIYRNKKHRWNRKKIYWILIGFLFIDEICAIKPVLYRF